MAEARLLVVDDEPNIVELLSTSLRFAGFEVFTAMTGAEALRAVERHHPDLVVLDIMLPDVDGLTVLRRLHANHQPIPVVFLTARDAGPDKVEGLTLGGDDYVTKPFSLEELVARIRAVLRRTQPARADSGRLVVADLELDEIRHEVHRAGRAVNLSPTEFNLLRYLMVHADQVVSKVQILDAVWGYQFDGDTNIVESYISTLRRKLTGAGEAPLIHTLRGVGYVLRPPRASEEGSP